MLLARATRTARDLPIFQLCQHVGDARSTAEEQRQRVAHGGSHGTVCTIGPSPTRGDRERGRQPVAQISVAPPGLESVRVETHDWRRGLLSGGAPRLKNARVPTTSECARTVEILMRHLDNKISGGRRGARESLYLLTFQRSDPRAPETGSRCPCLGDLNKRTGHWLFVLRSEDDWVGGTAVSLATACPCWVMTTSWPCCANSMSLCKPERVCSSVAVNAAV